eukprot:TRINITY_DN1864_c0_g1_i1.p1 TRINITY_DN1864_c0_g1~~TRINITY_DN1864_c0_g1_i1.p1  ORF type:complete len:315 (-),score=66.99 TRINITY_DN1864_c0_g1_i1:37-981(-)
MGSSLSAVEIAQECERQEGPGALSGQVMIITGANSGVGLGILQALAPLGPKIFVAGRNRDKCERVIDQVKGDSGNGDMIFLEVDFSSFESVRKAAEEFKSYNIPLHYLFNNAGGVFDTYTETKDGFEATLQTNHLGPALFTELLVENLARAEGGRIIHTSSAAYVYHNKGVLNWDDLTRRGAQYQGFPHAYSGSKLLQILYTRECQRIWGEDKKISSFAFHPGFVASNLGKSNLFGQAVLALTYPIQRSIDQGASTAVYCALSDEAFEHAGGYFADNAFQELPAEVIDPEVCKTVRENTLKWVGLLEPDIESKS